MMVPINENNPCSAVLADDEPLAILKLQRLLEPVTWINVIGTAANGKDTIAALDELKPDVVFLDINMPAGNGLEVLRTSNHLPHVIFTTAYDEYAVAAFELGAVDYLLKPFGAARLATALKRLKGGLFPIKPDSIEHIEKSMAGDDTLGFFLVRSGRSIERVPFKDIELVESDAEYIRLHSPTREFLLTMRLYEAENRLEGQNFLKVHRSRIVNLAHVNRFTSILNGRYEILMNSGRMVRTSRSGGQSIRKLLA